MMKKIVSALIVFSMLVSCCMFSTGSVIAAGDPTCNIVAVGDSYAEMGEVYTVDIYVRDIKNTLCSVKQYDEQYNEIVVDMEGIMTTTFSVNYDVNVFESVSYTADVPSNWEYFENVQTPGVLKLFSAWDDAPFEGVTEDDQIVFHLTFNLKPDAELNKTTMITVTEVDFSTCAFKRVVCPDGNSLEVEVIPNRILHKKSEAEVVIDYTKNIIKGFKEKTNISDFYDKFLEPSEEFSLTDILGDAVTDLTKKVCNGSKMTVTDKATQDVAEFIIILMGDVDCDGDVTVSDYLNIKALFKAGESLDGYRFVAADIDGDEYISSADYLRLKHYLKGYKNLI